MEIIIKFIISQCDGIIIMKHFFLFLLPAIFSSVAGKAASGALKTQSPGDSVAVVISDAKLAKPQHGSLAGPIKSMAGVNYVAYCANHAVYILYIKTTAYKSRQYFYEALVQSTGVSDIYLKNSDNPLQLLDNCQMDAATSDNLKVKNGK